MVLRRFTNDNLMTEKLIRTTAKLYDARDAMRRLHGENWPQKINEISPIIRGVAKEGNTSILSAAIQIAEKASKDGQPMVSVMVLAVACELSENSQDPPTL
jgi:ketosteroid isomerase-like protein